eukprot:jgi/Pico_ML_1/52578/g3263.t2
MNGRKDDRQDEDEEAPPAPPGNAEEDSKTKNDGQENTETGSLDVESNGKEQSLSTTGKMKSFMKSFRKGGKHNTEAAPFSLISTKSIKKLWTVKVDLETEDDKQRIEEWLRVTEYNPSPKFRSYFIGFFSFGTIKSDGHAPTEDDTPAYRRLYWLSGVNWIKWFCIPFLVLLLWCFLFFLDVLSTGFRLVAGRASGELLGSDLNPIGLCGIGILATVLVQSSSTSTSIAVAMVGADAIGVDSAVYIIMGSNIGTSVTNTIVAVGNIQNDDDFRRAFQGSTVHDIFNYLCVIIFLPLQWATKFLTKLTFEMSKDVSECEGSCEDWEGPIKKLDMTFGLCDKPILKGGAFYDAGFSDELAAAAGEL